MSVFVIRQRADRFRPLYLTAAVPPTFGSSGPPHVWATYREAVQYLLNRPALIECGFQVHRLAPCRRAIQ